MSPRSVLVLLLPRSRQRVSLGRPVPSWKRHPMLPIHLPPMLVANTQAPTPVMLAGIFAVGVYLLYCGITYLREGKIGSRHGTTVTPQKQPIVYWTNVT